MARLGTRGRRIEFFPYLGQSELQAEVETASLVVTDLPHVAAWARERGVDVLAIRDDMVSYFAGATPAADVLRALGDALPQKLPLGARSWTPRHSRDGAEPRKPPPIDLPMAHQPQFREERAV
jgi:hypothetical protein